MDLSFYIHHVPRLTRLDGPAQSLSPPSLSLMRWQHIFISSIHSVNLIWPCRALCTAVLATKHLFRKGIPQQKMGWCRDHGVLSSLQPSVFLQVFATVVLLQEYIEEARDVGSYCNEGFATRVLLQKNKRRRFASRVLLQKNREEKVLQ